MKDVADHIGCLGVVTDDVEPAIAGFDNQLAQRSAASLHSAAAAPLAAGISTPGSGNVVASVVSWRRRIDPVPDAVVAFRTAASRISPSLTRALLRKCGPGRE